MAQKAVDIHGDIISRCIQGDRKAQHKLYELYSRAMYNTTMRIVNNTDDAKDILQEAFIDMYNKLESFRGEASFGSWFKRIVINKSLNHIKKFSPAVVDYQEVEIEDISEPYKERFEFGVTEVKKAMNELPKGYKLIFDLYMFEGYTHKEIGSYLGISEATSKSQLSRAKVKLKEFLELKN